MTEPSCIRTLVITTIAQAWLSLLPTFAQEIGDVPALSRLVFETTEGTWMGVDLHPESDRFLFGLLGDVYELSGRGGDEDAGVQARTL